MARILVPAITLFATVALAGPIDWPAHQPPAAADFAKAIAQYVELHRQIEVALPALTLTGDAEDKARVRRALAAAIREARVTAAMGDIFTVRVSAYFRNRIATAVHDADGGLAGLFGRGYETGLPYVPLAINQALPWGAGDIRWPLGLAGLPALPDELEYRVWGPDLLLVDVEANLVVDVLERALLEQEAPPLVIGNPCDAHPELPMCWS